MSVCPSYSLIDFAYTHPSGGLTLVRSAHSRDSSGAPPRFLPLILTSNILQHRSFVMLQHVNLSLASRLHRKPPASVFHKWRITSRSNKCYIHPTHEILVETTTMLEMYV